MVRIDVWQKETFTNCVVYENGEKLPFRILRRLRGPRRRLFGGTRRQSLRRAVPHTRVRIVAQPFDQCPARLRIPRQRHADQRRRVMRQFGHHAQRQAVRRRRQRANARQGVQRKTHRVLRRHACAIRLLIDQSVQRRIIAVLQHELQIRPAKAFAARECHHKTLVVLQKFLKQRKRHRRIARQRQIRFMVMKRQQLLRRFRRKLPIGGQTTADSRASILRQNTLHKRRNRFGLRDFQPNALIALLSETDHLVRRQPLAADGFVLDFRIRTEQQRFEHIVRQLPAHQEDML